MNCPDLCVSYLTQVAQQPRVCMRLAEAGQPVCVPGMSHQQLHRPNYNYSNQSSTYQMQDLTEASQAENLRENTFKERHAGAEKLDISRG